MCVLLLCSNIRCKKVLAVLGRFGPETEMGPRNNRAGIMSGSGISLWVFFWAGLGLLGSGRDAIMCTIDHKYRMRRMGKQIECRSSLRMHGLDDRTL